MTALLGLIFIFSMIAAAGFFAGTETGLLSVSKHKIRSIAARGNKNAILIQNLLEKPTLFIGTALVGINLAHVTLSVVSTWYFNSVFKNPKISSIVTVVVITPLLLFFGEILPKAIFRLRPHEYTLKSAKVFNLSAKIFMPATSALTFIVELIMPLSSIEEPDRVSRREEILSMVREGEKSGSVEGDEKEMIESVFELSEKTLREVMVPRVSMSAISLDMSFKEVLQKVAAEGYTRYPVIDANIENISGILHVADLLGRNTIEISALSKPLFLSEFTRVDDALEELRSKGVHMAIVVDEYGVTAGLVTIEDLLEEMVGEIDDEHDEAPVRYRKIEENRWIVDALIDVGELMSALGISFDEEQFEAETVGGIILEKAGRILKSGEFIDIGQIRFKVISADERRIIRVEIEKRKMEFEKK